MKICWIKNPVQSVTISSSQVHHLKYIWVTLLATPSCPHYTHYTFTITHSLLQQFISFSNHQFPLMSYWPQKNYCDYVQFLPELTCTNSHTHIPKFIQHWGPGKTTINVTGPRKTPLNAGIPEFIFIVESDKAFSKLQNDRPPSYYRIPSWPIKLLGQIAEVQSGDELGGSKELHFAQRIWIIITHALRMVNTSYIEAATKHKQGKQGSRKITNLITFHWFCEQSTFHFEMTSWQECFMTRVLRRWFQRTAADSWD